MRQGTSRALRYSYANAAAFAYKYLRDRDVPCLLHQCRYNILNREPETQGILDQAK